MEVELVARGTQEADLLGIGHTCAPHAWARRKDLEGVGSQIRGFTRRIFQPAGCERVYAEPHRSMLTKPQANRGAPVRRNSLPQGRVARKRPRIRQRSPDLPMPRGTRAGSADRYTSHARAT